MIFALIYSNDYVAVDEQEQLQRRFLYKTVHFQKQELRTLKQSDSQAITLIGIFHKIWVLISWNIKGH